MSSFKLKQLKLAKKQKKYNTYAGIKKKLTPSEPKCWIWQTE